MVRRKRIAPDLEKLKFSQQFQSDWPQDLDPAEVAASKAWLVTFTDLVSLLLTFFVLLFSMSNVKVSEWENIIDSLSRTLAPTPEKVIKARTATFNIGTVFRKRAINLDYLASVIREGITDVEALKGTHVQLMEDRLIVALPGDLLFAPGRADMAESAREAIFIIGGMLRNIGNEIGVNGHTDPAAPAKRAPGEGGYESNWELSTARAAAIANALRQAGYPDEIIAFGYAGSRFKQLPKLPDAARRALARRVDVVILPTSGGLSR